jgi:hypothetical protein
MTFSKKYACIIPCTGNACSVSHSNLFSNSVGPDSLRMTFRERMGLYKQNLDALEDEIDRGFNEILNAQAMDAVYNDKATRKLAKHLFPDHEFLKPLPRGSNIGKIERDLIKEFPIGNSKSSIP